MKVTAPASLSLRKIMINFTILNAQSKLTFFPRVGFFLTFSLFPTHFLNTNTRILKHCGALLCERRNADFRMSVFQSGGMLGRNVHPFFPLDSKKDISILRNT